MRIVATEFRFTPRKVTLRPGMYRFRLLNRGEVFLHKPEDPNAARAGRSDETDERATTSAEERTRPGRTPKRDADGTPTGTHSPRGRFLAVGTAPSERFSTANGLTAGS
jgi:hypothetical protein